MHKVTVSKPRDNHYRCDAAVPVQRAFPVIL